MVRPDDPERVGLLVAHLAQLVGSRCPGCAGGRVELEPAGPVDVGDAQRPLGFEHIRMRIGTGIIVFAKPVMGFHSGLQRMQSQPLQR
jgi:hypothetical protein